MTDQEFGDNNLFEVWLESCLVLHLQLGGDVIVIDNATFYHDQAIEDLVAQA